MAICPRTGTTIHNTGLHLLVDLHGASHLDDMDYIQSACEAAAVATGATILKSSFHHFGEGAGVSGVVLLAESHLSIHTWNEYSLATFDVFVCGSCDPELALPVLEKWFKPSSVDVSLHKRGKLKD